jgi:uncharacterized membrane protein
MKDFSGSAADVLQTLATALLGLMAGFFFAFAVDVVPSMRELDASTYITVQQAINRAVRNLTFAAVYFGAAALPFAAALALALAGRRTQAWLWLGIATAYLLGVFVLTREINVPINDALALWDAKAPPAAWRQARDDWNRANLLRAGAACASFVAALLAMRRAR